MWKFSWLNSFLGLIFCPFKKYPLKMLSMSSRKTTSSEYWSFPVVFLFYFFKKKDLKKHAHTCLISTLWGKGSTQCFQKYGLFLHQQMHKSEKQIWQTTVKPAPVLRTGPVLWLRHTGVWVPHTWARQIIVMQASAVWQRIHISTLVLLGPCI